MLEFSFNYYISNVQHLERKEKCFNLGGVVGSGSKGRMSYAGITDKSFSPKLF